MGLRCLVGHDYGAPETDRERSDQGEEVIVTVTEYKECSRCGHRQVISENTEVKSIAPTEPAPESTAEPVETEYGTSQSHHEEFEDITAEEDDGVILEDEPADAAERGHGEWPPAEADEAAQPETDDDAPDSTPDESTEWPDPEGEDEGYTAGPAESGGADVEFGGGLTPETNSGDEAAGEMLTAEGSGISRAETGPGPTDRQHSFGDGSETEYVCPSCDHTAPAVESSLRPGDICPNCQSGYLTERPQE